MYDLYKKVRGNSSRALIFLTGSVAAQGISALTGLLLARWLAVSDYATYTIMITLIGAMSILTKGGATFGYSAILGRVWPDRKLVSEAVLAVTNVRKKVSIFVLPFVIASTSFLLDRNEVSFIENFILCLFIVALWWADMKTSLVEQVLFYAKITTSIQVLDTFLSILRLIAISVIYLFSSIYILPVMLISVLVASLRILPINKWAGEFLQTRDVENNNSFTKEINGSVKKQLPVEIYYVFQAQIVLFCLSFFSNSQDVAGFGALGRIAQLLVPVTMFTYAFSIPIYTRASENVGRLLILFILLSLAPGLFLLCISVFYPDMLLWLIGPNYSNMHNEIIWAVFATLISVTSGVFRNLVSSRGKMKYNFLQIPLGFLWVGIAVFLIDLSTIIGAFQLQIGFAICAIICGLIDFFTGETKEKRSV
ncbi:hypothetical protein [Leucothrix arctica]|uniref:Polysaccharide biosynthesis protein n=1 Tax=Leucothrix arctica TaxID=1481894 RepID=A0A317CQZ7_9GAMM|nr:hypothetical protein [Leucothrix arctica]PWQ98712.1 hypothetical protein DKT75_02560 [Leucothrix arctica]